MAEQLRWVDLEHPVEVDGQLVTSIAYRVPNRDDVARARDLSLQLKRGSANTRIMIQIAQVLANAEPETIRKLHLSDLHKALEATLEILQAHTRPSR